VRLVAVAVDPDLGHELALHEHALELLHAAYHTRHDTRACERTACH
jgi:hypothetical protein